MPPSRSGRMDARRFRRLAEVFERVVEIADAGERETRARELCAGDAALVETVLRLLAVHDATPPDALVRSIREALERLGRDLS